MPGALQGSLGPAAGREHGAVGMHLVGAEQRARAGHDDGMVPLGPPFRDQEMVPAVPLVEVRPLGEAERRSLEDHAALPEQAAAVEIHFLRDDAGEAAPARPMIPQHVERPAASVVVVKQRRIEAAAVEVDGIGPVAIDPLAPDPVIVEVAQRRAPAPSTVVRP